MVFNLEDKRNSDTYHDMDDEEFAFDTNAN